MHTNLAVSFAEQTGAYFGVNMHRIEVYIPITSLISLHKLFCKCLLNSFAGYLYQCRVTDICNFSIQLK